MAKRSKILILGSKGRLGAALAERCAQSHDVIAFGRQDLNLIWEPGRIQSVLGSVPFDVLINAAGHTGVDYSELHPEEAMASNATGPGAVAAACQAKGARMIQISTDYVFSGQGKTPLKETDSPAPVQVYGDTKWKGEQRVLETCNSAVVARVSWLFGLQKLSFPDRMLEQAMATENVSAVADKWSSPTSAEDLVGWLLFLIEQRPDFRGHVHLCNGGSCTWQEYAQHALDIAIDLGLPLKTSRVRSIDMTELKDFVAARPRYTVLDTSLFQATTGIVPRSWKDALADYLRRHYVTALE